MINKTVTVRELREKISSTSIVNMGSLNQSHPPGNVLCHNIRLRAAWYTMTRVYWEKWAFHIMERDQTSLPEIENRAKTLWEILLGEGASLDTHFGVNAKTVPRGHSWSMHHPAGRLGGLDVNEGMTCRLRGRLPSFLQNDAPWHRPCCTNGPPRWKHTKTCRRQGHPEQAEECERVFRPSR